MWLILALFSAVAAAAVAILGKLGLQNVDPVFATTIRSLVMASFFVVTSLFLNKFTSTNIASLSNKDWWLIVGAGLAGAISWLLYFMALKIGLATKVVVIDRLSLVFVIVLAAIFLGEAMSWKAVFGAILMVAGAIIISLK